MKRTITIHPLAATRADLIIEQLYASNPDIKRLKTDDLAGLAILTLDYILKQAETASNEAVMDYLRAALAIVANKKSASSEQVQHLIQKDKLALVVMRQQNSLPQELREALASEGETHT